MTLTMAAHITFPASRGRARFDIRRVSNIRIESSWKDFTAKAEITFPRNVSNIHKFKYADLFKNGDPVIIRFGYGDGELPVEFTGYLCDTSEGVPITLRCEDEMYMLKRGDMSVASSKITLKELLRKTAVGYEVDCDDVQLGAVRYAHVAPIKILEDIKKETGLQSYFDGKILRCGVIYSDQSDIAPVKILLEKNAVSENLNKKAPTDEVSIKAISILANGKKISVEVGRKGGTSVQRTYINITAKIDLEKQAYRDLERYKAQGYDGSVTLFGVPRVQHGMKIDLRSEFYKNMEGVFLHRKSSKNFRRKWLPAGSGIGGQSEMNELDKFGEIFRRKLGEVRQSQLRFASCKEVDWENKTMTAIGLYDDLEYHDVQLGYGFADIKPAIDATCLIGILEGREALTFLINAEEVELVEIKASQINYNGSENRGIVKVKELCEKLNVIEKDLNDIKMVFNSWVTIPNDGGAALKAASATWAGSRLQQTAQKDIENDKITH